MKIQNKALKFIRKYYVKYRFIILYIFFGGITTIINVFLYWLCYNIIHIPNVASTIIAWIGSVIFAFLSNKTWVFESHDWGRRTLLNEFTKFVFARLLTGGIDVLFMFLTVDLIHLDGFIMKIVANVFVMISNFVLSKLIVFRNN